MHTTAGVRTDNKHKKKEQTIKHISFFIRHKMAKETVKPRKHEVEPTTSCFRSGSSNEGARTPPHSPSTGKKSLPGSPPVPVEPSYGGDGEVEWQSASNGLKHTPLHHRHIFYSWVGIVFCLLCCCF